MSKFGIKVMVSTANQSGAKLVTDHEGQPISFRYRATADIYIRRKLTKDGSIGGIIQNYSIVLLDNPGWLS